MKENYKQRLDLIVARYNAAIVTDDYILIATIMRDLLDLEIDMYSMIQYGGITQDADDNLNNRIYATLMQCHTFLSWVKN